MVGDEAVSLRPLPTRPGAIPRPRRAGRRRRRETPGPASTPRDLAGGLAGVEALEARGLDRQAICRRTAARGPSPWPSEPAWRPGARPRVGAVAGRMAAARGRAAGGPGRPRGGPRSPGGPPRPDHPAPERRDG
jgi:hypothetical protein